MSNTQSHNATYPDMLGKFETYVGKLASVQPDLMGQFWKLHKTAVGDGVLDTKTKELMTLAISIAARCDGCIAHHVSDALRAGATKEEIAETLGVAVLMGGGTSVVYATHALEALEQFLEELT
ncbi:Carboxymuconolactone decarboxylase family protein [Roseovarius litorisediminis]|uniref:Carboxymuconolactone decarboxylase family protein n=1 Tax=Roseovarius litorisediminis TaxID=1312363 RepID=A0A1Y5TPW4_9RHOB|nr:carboxymuconolactone decarboxylase family protein [Roseovarius litorisediminis]SLN69197.1 Carboxymuconolactone decarboxylase family protein [Roseovarius litorisediminis]